MSVRQKKRFVIATGEVISVAISGSFVWTISFSAYNTSELLHQYRQILSRDKN